MHDAGPMRLLQALEDVNAGLQKVRKRQRTFVQTLCKCLALHIFHYQKLGIAITANIVQGANMRMIESRDGASFAFKSLLQLRRGHKRGIEHLDCNRPFQSGVAGTIDFPHTACSYERDDFIRPELCAGGEGHRCAPL